MKHKPRKVKKQKDEVCRGKNWSQVEDGSWKKKICYLAVLAPNSPIKCLLFPLLTLFIMLLKLLEISGSTRLMFVGGLKPSRLILRLVNLLPPRMPLRPVPSEENTLGVTPLIINCFWKVISLGLWSKGEQSTAVETATSTALQELIEWNAWYKEKFGFVFLICASGKSSAEILAELKKIA